MVTVRECLRRGAGVLGTSGEERVESEMLLAHVLGKERSFLFAWPEHPIAAHEKGAYEALVTRRAAGEPIAYLVGRRDFWSLKLEVTADTLIPRPETERLVECVLAHLEADSSEAVADLGTGSGAVALAVAAERHHCRVVGTDASAAALAVATRNARAHGLEHVEFRYGDWFEPLAGERFGIIVSNPPYIAAGDGHLSRGDLRFEPLAALAAGPDGLDAIRHIGDHARDHLVPGGWLLLEHGFDQGRAVRQWLRRNGYVDVQTHRDIPGHERVTEGRWGEPSA